MIGCRVRILAPHPRAGLTGKIAEIHRQMLVVHCPSLTLSPPMSVVHVYRGYVEFLDSAVDALGGLTKERKEL